MVMLMIGSSMFRFLERKWTIEQIYLGTLAVSTILFFMIALSELGYVIYGAFMVFEICCGLHFTCAGTLRSKYIPEETRAAVMNLFRVPLNILVCYVLYYVNSYATQTIFLICGVWLGLSTCAQLILARKQPSSSVLNNSGTQMKV